MMIGQTVSHYKILEELGAGGMGVVYKAEDTKLKRTVALKFLSPELTRDKDAKTRFIHEAQAASALQHHNICTIHEIDETPDGRLFIAMDCYDGETLREKIAKGPLPVNEALDITAQIVAGLAKAHQAEMIHRDIKPANVIVTSDGVAKILDFGLAKLAGMTKVTKTGTTVGTISYMSPEQATGEGLDTRSDIFSVGVVLYELLAGEPPFKSDHEAAILYSIIHKDPEPLSAYRSDVSDDAWRVVEIALAKNPDNRYANTADMLTDLESLRQSEAEIRGTSKPRQWVRNLVALGAVIIAIGIVALIITRQREPISSADELSLAVVDFRDLMTPDDPATSAEMTGLLHVGLVESSPVRVVSPDYLHDLRRRTFGSERGPIEEDQVLEVARKSGATLLLSGQVKEGHYVMWRLVDTQSGKSLAAQRSDGNNLVELADRIVAEVVPLLAAEAGATVPQPSPSVASMTTGSPEAYSHYIAGVLASEKFEWNIAIGKFESAVALDSTFALAYFGLSSVHYYTGGIDRKLALNYANLTWRHRTRLNIKDRLRLEAWQEQLNDHILEASALYKEMLTRWPDDRQLLKDFSSLLFWHAYDNENVSVMRQALALYPEDWTFTKHYATTLGVLGRLREALEVSRTWAEKHPSEASAWYEVGWRYYEMALPDSAEIAFRRALDIDSTFWSSERYLYHCHYCTGDVERAIKNLEQLLTRDYLLDGNRVWILSTTWYRPDLPVLYAELGQFDKSLACFERAGRIITTMDAELRLGARRATILLRMGRAEEVLNWARQSGGLAETRAARLDIRHMEARALVALDSLEAARSALAELRPLVIKGSQEEVLDIRARIELAEGNPEATLETLREWNQRGRFRVGGLQDIEYREMMAQAHRMSGHLDEAAKVHEEMLRVYHGHFLSHYNLGLIYEEMGRAAEAKKAYSTFLDSWKDADKGLPQLEDARLRLAALESSP